MRLSPLFVLLLFVFAAYGQQQQRVAIINTVDDRDSIGISDLAFLTNKLRETAVNILPKSLYGVMTTESIVAFFSSQERAQKECKAASCLAELGRKVSADYVAQAHIGRFGNQLSINFDLYNVASGNLIGSFAGYSKDIFGLLAIIEEKSPILFKQMLDESKPQKSEPSPEVEKLVIENPELAKLEPEPMKPEPEKPFKTSFWVALSLDLVGAAIIFSGYVSEQAAQDAYGKYKRIEPNSYYRETWEEVESKRNKRNTLYTVGGIFLVSGIGVHIWF